MDTFPASLSVPVNPIKYPLSYRGVQKGDKCFRRIEFLYHPVHEIGFRLNTMTLCPVVGNMPDDRPYQATEYGKDRNGRYIRNHSVHVDGHSTAI